MDILFQGQNSCANIELVGVNANVITARRERGLSCLDMVKTI